MSLKSCKWMFLGAALCSSPLFAATLQVSGGTLMGATGVDVNGTLYDVSFVDGSCNSLFSGCVESAFTFHNVTDAFAAANALQSQVFLGAFDNRSANTNGCVAGGSCSVYTPYDHVLPYDPNTANAYNAPTDASDLVFTTSIAPTATTGPNAVFAVWTPAVPVPAAAWLFGSALVGLAGASRRKRQGAVI